MSEQNTTDMSQHFYRASAADFMKVPGNPIAYWVGNSIYSSFNSFKSLNTLINTRKGLATSDNNRFLREWHECSIKSIGLGLNSREESVKSNKKWFPIHKGGSFRKWYGNHEHVINWENDGYEIRNFFDESGKLKSRPQNLDYSFKQALTWSKITSGNFSARICSGGFLFDDAGAIGNSDNMNLLINILPILTSKIGNKFLEVLSPTLNFQIGDVGRVPIINFRKVEADSLNSTKDCIKKSKKDWDSYETSWEFTSLPLLTQYIKQPTISTSYINLHTQWLADTEEMQRLEEENNRIFIDAYGLQDELTPDVPLKEITLTCNPHYRYGGDLTEQEREDRLQSDTIAELISYAIGCMMGRYSLDREGLVYAHAGNQGFAELVSEGAYTTFAADDDAILPITEQEWFSDDVTNRVSEFVRTVYDEQHLEENLQFIADSLCLYAIKPKKGERALETIRRYLGTQFYKDHLKTYKRRPIYWLFSSGKHKAFECMVYLHRYHEGTLARMRTEYVIPLTARINARINRLHEEVEAASSTSERNQINRELKALQNQQAELATFDEQLRHHADQRISLDLDDGVKENYGKFGDLLAAVKDVTGKAAD